MFGLGKSAEPSQGLLLQARDLTVRRGARTLLAGVEVALSPGEILSLVGHNGGGKSTLLRVLIGLEAASQGVLKRRRDLRVGYVPQNFFVDRNLPLTVGRFLQLAGSSKPDPEVLAAAAVEQFLTTPLQALSGGELRRVLLARALLRRPQLLALDEPAAGLDQHGQTELYQLIQHARDRYGCGVLVVSHDLHLVMAATDQVLCLGHGKVCCRGEPASVREHPEYVAMFGQELGPATALYPHQGGLPLGGGFAAARGLDRRHG